MIWLGDYDWRPRSPGIIYPLPLPLGAFKQYGVYPWPAGEDAEWIHADDLEIARRLLPSDRVFRRLAEAESFVVLGYGELRLRVRPYLCRAIEGEGIDIGDSVEVRSHLGRNEPLVGAIGEMRCPLHERAIQYFVRKGERLLPTPYRAADLQPLRSWSIGA
jgi:hypothetical protein